MCFQERNNWKSERPGLGCRVGDLTTLTDCIATIHRHVQHCEEDSYVTSPTSYAGALDIYIVLLTLISPLQTVDPLSMKTYKKFLDKRTVMTFPAVNMVLNSFGYKRSWMLPVIIPLFTSSMLWCIFISLPILPRNSWLPLQWHNNDCRQTLKRVLCNSFNWEPTSTCFLKFRLLAWTISCIVNLDKPISCATIRIFVCLVAKTYFSMWTVICFTQWQPATSWFCHKWSQAYFSIHYTKIKIFFGRHNLSIERHKLLMNFTCFCLFHMQKLKYCMDWWVVYVRHNWGNKEHYLQFT